MLPGLISTLSLLSSVLYTSINASSRQVCPGGCLKNAPRMAIPEGLRVNVDPSSWASDQAAQCLTSTLDLATPSRLSLVSIR
ncbi:hypothetical protein C8R45DRAFT_988285 [Mycena sanguinolenta]|nr:hypothetical protein C8R45DRAFT_988285 [Mycena sanguinolenta]